MASETSLASFGLIGLRLVELHGVDARRFALIVPEPLFRASSRGTIRSFESTLGSPENVFGCRVPVACYRVL